MFDDLKEKWKMSMAIGQKMAKDIMEKDKDG